MEKIIQNVQQKLGEITGFAYLDEDWGQLDYYSPNFPVKWPCGIIDVPNVNYSNVGMDRRGAAPLNRQMAEGVVSLTIANMKLTNTSGKAPQTQKDNASSIHSLIQEAHVKLQGFRPTENCGKLIRTGIRRTRRDDGVQEYTVLYSFSMTNV